MQSCASSKAADRASNTFTYDGRGQLKTITGPQVARYYYDAAGNRTAEASATDTITYFIPTNTNRVQLRTTLLGNTWYRHDDNGAIISDSTQQTFTPITGCAHGGGTSRSWQILRARRSLISVWLGTA